MQLVQTSIAIFVMIIILGAALSSVNYNRGNDNSSWALLQLRLDLSLTLDGDLKTFVSTLSSLSNFPRLSAPEKGGKGSD